MTVVPSGAYRCGAGVLMNVAPLHIRSVRCYWWGHSRSTYWGHLRRQGGRESPERMKYRRQFSCPPALSPEGLLRSGRPAVDIRWRPDPTTSRCRTPAVAARHRAGGRHSPSDPTTGQAHTPAVAARRQAVGKPYPSGPTTRRRRSRPSSPPASRPSRLPSRPTPSRRRQHNAESASSLHISPHGVCIIEPGPGR